MKLSLHISFIHFLPPPLSSSIILSSLLPFSIVLSICSYVSELYFNLFFPYCSVLPILFLLWLPSLLLCLLHSLTYLLPFFSSFYLTHHFTFNFLSILFIFLFTLSLLPSNPRSVPIYLCLFCYFKLVMFSSPTNFYSSLFCLWFIPPSFPPLPTTLLIVSPTVLFSHLNPFPSLVLLPFLLFFISSLRFLPYFFPLSSPLHPSLLPPPPRSNCVQEAARYCEV